jgi:uncharacterized protein
MNSTLNIARLLIACEKIEGRKKLQKIVHILQSSGFQRDFPHQFGYLHYGPYSHEVKADIDRLVDPSGPLVDEQPSVAGLSFQTFVYVPKPELQKALLSHATTPWEGLARKLNEMTPQELEAISTIRFLQRSGVAEQALLDRFKQLKPSLVELYPSALDFAKTLPTA